MNFRTPVKRARGLGSAQEGAGHWWAQRVSALALIPLSIWFVVSLIGVLNGSYSEVVAWLAQPLHAVLLSVMVLVLYYHSWLGVQVVIEDYIHSEWLKLTSLLLSQFIHALLAAGAVFVILRLAFQS